MTFLILPSVLLLSQCGLNFMLHRQVDRDCDFLEQERIMDYSLLVGVHFREVSGSGEPVTTEMRSSGVRTPTGMYVSP